MSSQVFPALPGLGWSIKRTPTFQTRKQVNISGKEVALTDWSAPRHQWELTFNLLRQGSLQGSTWTEMQQLFGFYCARNGGFDSFLYQDQDDNSVTGQNLGTGNGTNTLFPAVRTFGGATEPILAVNTLSAVYVNGTAKTVGTDYNWVTWAGTLGSGGAPSTSPPGSIGFAVAPAPGAVVTADFTYYWPCRFVEDSCEFEKFMAGRYLVKKLSFLSLK